MEEATFAILGNSHSWQTLYRSKINVLRKERFEFMSLLTCFRPYGTE